MSARLKACAPGACRDELMRGGKRARCTVCRTEFPCQGACGHYDCRVVRGDECPQAQSWYDPSNPPPLSDFCNVNAGNQE